MEESKLQAPQLFLTEPVREAAVLKSTPNTDLLKSKFKFLFGFTFVLATSSPVNASRSSLLRPVPHFGIFASPATL